MHIQRKFVKNFHNCIKGVFTMKTKKLIATGFVVLMACTMAFTSCKEKNADNSKGEAVGETTVSKTSAKASTETLKPNAESDFRVELTEDGAGVRVLEYIGTSPNVVIPDTIQGMPVVEVKSNFCGRNHIWTDDKLRERKDNNSIRKIVYPDTVTSLGDKYDFDKGDHNDYVALEYVKLSKNLKNQVAPYGATLPPFTFNGCEKLKEVIIPDEVSFEEMGSFVGCKSLKTINIPASVKILPPNSFSYCSSLQEIIFPESATTYDFDVAYPSASMAFEGTNLPLALQAKIKQFGYGGKF